ncbi:hypothetical protein [Vibrio algivorus]|uniref:Replication protein n=1 Tax=Vibrio algivorus TaxID=1667024 RepID=A0ABQ6EMC9_9VIBR|nr:hypothetical protein [Vibrio algivorus]GLT13871.1 hypothetical protein GCM10007931_08450 [Vibrio algivorus]
MAIYKASIKADYTVIPNSLAQDDRLSFDARGLILLLLSMPENWQVNKVWVQSKAPKCGRDKVTRLFKELQNFGYIAKKTVHDEKGLITGTDWLIYPTAQSVVDTDDSVTDDPAFDSEINRSTEKPSNGKNPTVQLKNRTPDKPYNGKPAAIKETDLQNKHKDLSSSQNSSDDKIKSIPGAGIQTPKGEKWGTKQDIDAVDWMYRRVRKVNEAARRPKLVNWANDIRLMRNALNVTHREICEMFKFANEHHFWAENIQSPKALRKQWDKLFAQKNTFTRPAANEPDFNDTSWADNVNWEL